MYYSHIQDFFFFPLLDVQIWLIVIEGTNPWGFLKPHYEREAGMEILLGQQCCSSTARQPEVTVV